MNFTLLSLNDPNDNQKNNRVSKQEVPSGCPILVSFLYLLYITIRWGKIMWSTYSYHITAIKTLTFKAER